MIDRRTYLAGQALAGVLATGVEYNDRVGPGDIAIGCLTLADTVLAELQRTCEHHWEEQHVRVEGGLVMSDKRDVLAEYAFYRPCPKCGAEKPSGGGS